ncbi:TonB-dependent receptor [Pseudomonas typographi]|uniref:TonB-dependent receptor n=1 Tax=Pseudomonas typographi TaxID=2715964 RepID=A0ABR7YX08_9PSED|nr:TonB-dependent receptor [Pseudomonas typographi]MBD1597704.1 TonB-dependent receptor [Pseudomonas typographi]
MFRFNRLVCSLCFGLGLTSAQAAQPPAVATTDTRAASQPAGAVPLATVRVEGQRQADPQQPPASTRELSGQVLEQQGIYRLEDLQQLASGLDVAVVDPYDTRLTLRGVGDGGGSEINIGMPSSVGLFLDNVYLSRPGMLSNDLLDIERADVLSGPQGTLYGFNTTGGAIAIQSRKPTFTPQGSIRQSIGQRGYTQTQGMFSGPLSQTLAGRINLSHTEKGGYVHNEYTGHELGGSNQDGLRGQLLWVPSSDFNLRLIADLNRATSYPVAVLDEANAVGVTRPYLDRTQLVGAHVVGGGYKVNTDDENKAYVRQGGLSAEANWALANGFNLRSVSAYRYFGFQPNATDSLDIPLYAGSGADVRDRVWSQDIRLDSPKGALFDYALGATYWGENLDTFAHDHYAAGNQTTQYYGSTSNTGKYVQRWGKIDDSIFSLYAQGTWHLSDVWDVTAGVRDSYEKKSGRFRRVNKNDFDSGDLNQYEQLPAAMLNVSYFFLPNVQGYLTLAYGEKSGGMNVSSGAAAKAGYDSLLVDPESTRGGELGVKSQWLDDRLGVDAALFWSEVRQFQTTAYDLESQSSYLINAGTMRSRGLETNVTLKPLQGLTLNFNGTLLDNKYLDFENAKCPAEVSLAANAPATCDMSGDRVFRSPKLTYNLSGRYEWQTFAALDAFVSARYAYRTWAYGTVDNSQFSRIPGYGLLNLATGLGGHYGDGRWNASLWLNNATNKRYYRTLNTGDYGSAFGVLGEPRTLGMTVGYDF